MRPSEWSLSRRIYSSIGLLAAVVLAVFLFMAITGVVAAIEAKNKFETLQDELTAKGLADLGDPTVYVLLSEQFDDAQRSAGRARSRLRFAGWATWMPVVGDDIERSRTQLSMAYFLARAGYGLASTFQAALSPQSDEPDQSLQITKSLEAAEPILARVESDLAEARLLRLEIGEDGLDGRYTSLLDTYLPQIQTLAYISSHQPAIIAKGYELTLELATVEALVSDPLQVLVSPGSVDASLDNLIEQSRGLVAELEPLRQTVRQSLEESSGAGSEILQTVDLIGQAAALLEHSAAGALGLLAVARAAEEEGLLTAEFGAIARSALEASQAGLTLAKQDAFALAALMDQQESEKDAPQLALGFAGSANLSAASVADVQLVLDRAFETAQFFETFLGFDGPRSYLLLAQNQQEIRATGGFIGAAIRATVDQGELVELDFKDSTTVDLLPPTYANNPLPPEPLYWYLWMGRLLFRDANWSPHFPTSAARVADVYRLGQGSQLDGVFTGSKALLVKLTDLIEGIEVPGIDVPLTGEITQAYTDGNLPYACTDRHVSTRGQRCFDEDAFFALYDRLTDGFSGQERASVVQLFRDELAGGNMMAHIFDLNEGRLLWELGWNGAILPVDHDYLQIVDSSLPGHTTESVRRSWEYQVVLHVGRPLESQLRLRYTHLEGLRADRVCRQSVPESSNCFWNYFRVYVPNSAIDMVAPPVPLNQGAEKLIWGYPEADSSSLVRSADVGPARLTEIGGFIAVAPDSVVTVPIEYRLPWGTVRSTGEDSYEYRLRIEKQPGIDNDTGQVLVQLPGGASIIAVSQEPVTNDDGRLVFEFNLDTDKELAITFSAGGG